MSVAIVLSLLGVCATLIALYPCRKKPFMALGLASMCLIFLIWADARWGGVRAYHDYLSQLENKQQAKQILSSVTGKAQLIRQLQVHLKQHPDRAQGWYLLGRVYVSQQEWTKAAAAFQKAYQLSPQTERFVLNYAQAQFMLHQQSLTPELQTILKAWLTDHPQAGEALLMLASDAYQRHDRATAVRYWRQVLLLLPAQSSEAQMIRQAIKKATQSNGKDEAKWSNI